jgi:hypothetical protein
MSKKFLYWICFVGCIFVFYASAESFTSISSSNGQIIPSTSGSSLYQDEDTDYPISFFNYPSGLSGTTDFLRPHTGTFITGGRRSGKGELSIKNGHDRDAVAVLTFPNKDVYLAVYIRNSDSFTITGIQDNTYNLYFTLGKKWDDDIGEFTKDKSFFRFERSLPFETASNYNGYQYTTYELTLHPVKGGNTVANMITEKNFPVIR